MIPKKLHYLWIGPYQDNRTFVNEWTTVMPEYELHRWNNENTAPYFEEAIDLFRGLDNLERTTFTYMSDMVRLLIMRDHGGIYLDHDIAVLNDLSPLLENKGLVMTFMYDPNYSDQPNVWHLGTKAANVGKDLYAEGLYHSDTINNCFFAADKNHPIINRMIEVTVENHFRPKDQQYPMSDWCSGPGVFSEVCRELGIPIENSITVEQNNVIIYERDLLHPVHGMERMQIGAEVYNQRIERYLAEKDRYAIHVHDHYGTDLYFSNKMIFFDEWYKENKG